MVDGRVETWFTQFMETTTATNTTFRVQVAAFAPTGMRMEGHSVKVQAADKAEAATLATEAAAKREAEQVAKFNAECARFGTSPRTALTNWKAERVTRCAR